MNIDEKAVRRILRSTVREMSCLDGGQIEQLSQKVSALERCVDQFATLFGLDVSTIARFEDKDT